MKRHKNSISVRQLQILNELASYYQNGSGICYHDSNGEYNPEIKNDLEFLKSWGFIAEYVSEKHITTDNTITKKAWILTYHGIGLLFAINTKEK